MFGRRCCTGRPQNKSAVDFANGFLVGFRDIEEPWKAAECQCWNKRHFDAEQTCGAINAPVYCSKAP